MLSAIKFVSVKFVGGATDNEQFIVFSYDASLHNFQYFSNAGFVPTFDTSLLLEFQKVAVNTGECLKYEILASVHDEVIIGKQRRNQQ